MVAPCYMGAATLPGSVVNSSTTYIVTSIADEVFKDCTTLTTMTLPNSITSIGDQAFNSCIGLTSITLSNTITSIGANAFNICQALTSITLPNTITSIGTQAFNSCIGLRSVTFALPNTRIMSIENSAFRSCAKLASIILPNSITSIGMNAFDGCTDLASITFPNSLRSIGNASLKDCTSLTSISFPYSIESIDPFAFNRCTGLETVSINKATPFTINANVFNRVPLTTSVTLKVPVGSRGAYVNANSGVWSTFKTIEEDSSLVPPEPPEVVSTKSHFKKAGFSISITANRLEIKRADWALKINKIQIINLLGQVVETSKENNIALSNLPAGVYIVSVYTKNGRFSKKFVRGY